MEAHNYAPNVPTIVLDFDELITDLVEHLLATKVTRAETPKGEDIESAVKMMRNLSAPLPNGFNLNVDPKDYLSGMAVHLLKNGNEMWEPDWHIDCQRKWPKTFTKEEEVIHRQRVSIYVRCHDALYEAFGRVLYGWREEKIRTLGEGIRKYWQLAFAQKFPALQPSPVSVPVHPHVQEYLADAKRTRLFVNEAWKAADAAGVMTVKERIDVDGVIHKLRSVPLSTEEGWAAFFAGMEHFARHGNTEAANGIILTDGIFPPPGYDTRKWRAIALAVDADPADAETETGRLHIAEAANVAAHRHRLELSAPPPVFAQSTSTPTSQPSAAVVESTAPSLQLETTTTPTQTTRRNGKPSSDRQSDILAAIQMAGIPLKRPELIDAMKLKTEGKLGANLAWMVEEGILQNIPQRGYWPAGEIPPL